MKALIQKKYVEPNVHRDIVYNSQDMEGTQVSIDERLDKQNAVQLALNTSMDPTSVESVNCGPKIFR